ncbi:hypothetical protein HYV84_04965 [Candidatus Woesearchaeota archaeon]|nr:hypothetical protein [Candidatus Woesearchaeota archaeon]
MGEESAPAETGENAENYEGGLLASYALEDETPSEGFDSGRAENRETANHRRGAFYASKSGKAVEEQEYGTQHTPHGRQAFFEGQNLDGLVEREETVGGSEIRERTLDGAVAIIAYQDPDSGEVKEYLLEENPSDYALQEYAGKLRFIGGAIDRVNGSKEDPYTALAREFSEEIPSREAVNILLKYLESKTPYKTVQVDVEGEKTETHIFKVLIPSWDEWQAVVGANLGDDAGFSRVVTLDDILTLGKKGFAFNDFEVIHEFAAGGLPQNDPEKKHPHKSSGKNDPGHDGEQGDSGSEDDTAHDGDGETHDGGYH